jgi:Type IV secretion system pilin
MIRNFTVALQPIIFIVLLFFSSSLSISEVNAIHLCDPGLPPDEYNSCVSSPANQHGTGGSGGGGTGGSGSGGTGGSGGCAPGQLCNPLQSRTIQEFLLKIIDIILIFAQPVIIFFIMYAGYLFVTARGNESQITEARTALTWALIGGVVILGARAIITVIQGTVDAL